jgi:glycosyltransferase involved in cell wall biosynthesis
VRVLVWQWGRIGSGPRFAAMLADGLRGSPAVTPLLSLSRRADVLESPNPPRCDLVVETYRGVVGFAARALIAPWLIWRLLPRLRALAPDLAICAHPGPMDLIMGYALRRLGVPFVVIVHDADPHPGDGLPFLMTLQRRLCRLADGVAALTRHVGDRLGQQGLTGPAGAKLIRIFMPPLRFGAPPPRPADGPLRLLFFGRLLPYKGMDLLTEALDALGPRDDIVVRVVGSGPESSDLARLRDRPGVTVENRWVPEQELGTLLGWAHALVLPYREASQSGVAAAGLAAGCAIVATAVGGLEEQLGGLPNVTLCPPEAAAIAAAIDTMARDRPPALGAGVDADAAWRDMAALLLRQAPRKA